MKYQFKDKSLNIPDDELVKNMKLLNISKMEAVQMWLEDNDYLVNDEQEELNNKTKNQKINHGASATGRKGTRAPRERKENPEKRALIQSLFDGLNGLDIVNKKITKPEREIAFEIGNNSYSLTLTCHRNK